MLFWKNDELTTISSLPFFTDALQGRGVFETILVSENKTFLWDDHIQRLKSGIKFLGNQLRFDFEKLHKNIVEYFLYKNFNGLYRLNLFYLPEIKGIIIRIFPFKWPIKPSRLYINENYQRGNTPHYQFKTISRMEYIFFQQLAKENNCDDYLISNSNNQILETCLANIFFVRQDGSTETPVAENMPFLNGVLRNYIIKNQKALGIKCIEKKIFLNSISDYTQAFITNGLRLVQPVSRIGKYSYTKEDIGWKLKEKIYNSILNM